MQRVNSSVWLSQAIHSFIYWIASVGKEIELCCMQVAQFRFIEVGGLFKLKPIYWIKPLYLQIIILCRNSSVDSCVHDFMQSVMICKVFFAVFFPGIGAISFCNTSHFIKLNTSIIRVSSKALRKKGERTVEEEHQYNVRSVKKIEIHKSRLAFCPFFRA